nr:RHS repeat-associated core domain-containing protein [Xanthomonas albilineans]
MAEYVYLAGSLLATRLDGVVTYQHTDALGSPVATTDGAGQVVDRTQYEPYGAAIGKSVDGIGYTGHVMDAGTGLVYMQQRYYDPVIPRFLSVDPVKVDATNGGNFNRYKYAANNPYSFKDPDGRQECRPCDKWSDTYAKAAKEGTTSQFKPFEKPAMAAASAALPASPVLRTLYGALRAFIVSRSDELTGEGAPGHTIPPDRAPHIFREAEGHMPRDTPRNREDLQRVADDPKTTLGNDKYGNTWSAQINKDGTQTWTQTRNGEIRNGGINEAPKDFNPGTGLSNPIKQTQNP